MTDGLGQVMTVLSRGTVHSHATAMAKPVAGITPEGSGDRFVSPVSGAWRTPDAHNHACKISGNVTLKHEEVAGFTRRCRR